MTVCSELVSVIIPAFNAADTLSETLASVRQQSHGALDIVIVDDGSRDDTLAIAQTQAAEDARIQVISQENSGTAVARNRGIAASRGALIAPIDADDLWRRDKIARQLGVLRRAGPRVGLVYTWYAVIDGESRVTSLLHRPLAEGDVLQQMCGGNVVGNGSAPLIPRRVLDEVGGYDPRQPHFCEDMSLYLRIAERYEFALVPEHLTGYRQRTRSMSNRVLEMLRAYDQVLVEFRAKYPQYEKEFQHARADMIRWLVRKAMKSGRMPQAVLLLLIAGKTSPSLAGELILDEAEELGRSFISRVHATFARNLTTMTDGNAGEFFLR